MCAIRFRAGGHSNPTPSRTVGVGDWQARGEDAASATDNAANSRLFVKRIKSMPPEAWQDVLRELDEAERRARLVQAQRYAKSSSDLGLSLIHI